MACSFLTWGTLKKFSGLTDEDGIIAVAIEVGAVHDDRKIQRHCDVYAKSNHLKGILIASLAGVFT